MECLGDGDCTAAGAPICNTMTNTCGPCTMDSQCTDPLAPACGGSGDCVQCTGSNDSACMAPTPACDTPIAPLLAALAAAKYDGWIAVEPFVYAPDGPTCAARAIGYLRGLLDSLPARLPTHPH